VLPFRLVSTSSTTSQTLMQLLMIVELPWCLQQDPNQAS
jgi:hypothetical protein